MKKKQQFVKKKQQLVRILALVLVALLAAGTVGWRMFLHRKNAPTDPRRNDPFFGEEDRSDK